MNNSPRVKQLKAYQEIANSRPRAKLPSAYQARADTYILRTTRTEDTSPEHTLQGKFAPAERAVIQRVGPNGQDYVEARGAHLERHLPEWSYYIPAVRSVDDVRTIARDIFEHTGQYDWNISGDNATIDSEHEGHKVRLVWSREGRGIITCFIKETVRESETRQAQQRQQQQGARQPQQGLQQPQQGLQQPQQQGAQPVVFNGYYWNPDYSYWFDPHTHQWRSRVENQGGRNFDWLNMVYV
jgi:hypothetical protein